MHYKSRTYQLNSLRLGLINEDNLYGKPTVFVTVGSQGPNVKQTVKKYLQMHKEGKHNVIAIPYDLEGWEPGDDYEIYTYYENFLGIEFYVSEKLQRDHIFFKHFGVPTKNFTEYHFSKDTAFIGMFNE
tara:strand:- start:81 stop:467 length:387 start_codon:yes stop_codon:yes gene_type:complete